MMEVFQMTPKERKIIFTLAADVPECFAIIHSLYQFRRKGQVLTWLYDMGITGNDLRGLYHQFNSPILFYAHCLRRAEGRNYRRIMADDLV